MRRRVDFRNKLTKRLCAGLLMHLAFLTFGPLNSVALASDIVVPKLSIGETWAVSVLRSTDIKKGTDEADGPVDLYQIDIKVIGREGDDYLIEWTPNPKITADAPNGQSKDVTRLLNEPPALSLRVDSKTGKVSIVNWDSLQNRATAELQVLAKQRSDTTSEAQKQRLLSQANALFANRRLVEVVLLQESSCYFGAIGADAGAVSTESVDTVVRSPLLGEELPAKLTTVVALNKKNRILGYSLRATFDGQVIKQTVTRLLDEISALSIKSAPPERISNKVSVYTESSYTINLENGMPFEATCARILNVDTYNRTDLLAIRHLGKSAEK